MPAAKKLRGFEGFFYFSIGDAVSSAGVTTSASAAFSVASGAGISVGMGVSGTGVPVGATVATFSGTSGTLSANATATGTPTLTFTPVKTKLAHCSGWDIDIKLDQIDATDHDTLGWKDNLDGLRDFTGTIDSLYFTNDTTQTALLDAILAGGQTIIGEFRPLDVVGEVNYTGNLVITDYKAAAKLSTAQARNVSFAGRGALTRGTIAA